MAYIDPQQELFTRIKLDLEARAFSVFDGVMPPEDTPYPFVYLGDFSQGDIDTKHGLTGSVHATIHVWHNNPQKRGTVSSMMAEIKMAARKIERTAHFGWYVRNVNSRIIPDNTTKTPLLHGIIEADFSFS